MILLDVNVLVYAYRDDSAEHPPMAAFLNDLVNSGSMFGVPETCMSSLVRIVTHKAFKPPSTTASVFHFCDALRAVPTFLQIQPSDRHWKIFQEICLKSRATGALVADAYLAAFAIDRGDEWVTTDTDFSKFPGLTWRHPLKRQSITNPR